MALKSIRPIQPTAATMPSKAVAPMTPAAPKTPLSQVGDIRGHFLPGLPVIGADKQKDAGSRDIDRNTAPKKDLPYAWQQMTKFMPSQAVNPNAKTFNAAYTNNFSDYSSFFSGFVDKSIRKVFKSNLFVFFKNITQ